MPVLLVFGPVSFIQKCSSAPKAMPPLTQLNSVNVTEIGKTYHGLLSYAKNGQTLSQFYVDFKGPIMAGVATGSIIF